MPLRGVVHAQVVADLPDHDLAGVKADAGREAEPVLALHLGGVAVELFAEVERGIARALGVIFVRDRCAEQGHDAVARVLVDRAFEAVDAVGQ